MNPIQTQISPLEEERIERSNYWLELSLRLSCWIGIFALILIITRGAFAIDHPSKAGFLPGARSMSSTGTPPPSATPHGSLGKGNYYEEDEEDDDMDLLDEPPHAAQ